MVNKLLQRVRKGKIMTAFNHHAAYTITVPFS
jgi:hypothetical protein